MSQVLYRIWSGQVTTKSDISRQLANEIAEAASRGWITTMILHKTPPNNFGSQWRMTPKGLLHLFTAPTDEDDSIGEHYPHSDGEDAELNS